MTIGCGLAALCARSTMTYEFALLVAAAVESLTPRMIFRDPH